MILFWRLSCGNASLLDLHHLRSQLLSTTLFFYDVFKYCFVWKIFHLNLRTFLSFFDELSRHEKVFFKFLMCWFDWLDILSIFFRSKLIFVFFQICLNCVIRRDLQYNLVTPTFRHWGVNAKKFGLTFPSPADAKQFDAAVEKAIEELKTCELRFAVLWPDEWNRDSVCQCRFNNSCLGIGNCDFYQLECLKWIVVHY